MSPPLAIVVAKRSSWQRFVEETQDPHVLELLRRNDPSVSRMRAAHEAHEACVREVFEALALLSIGARHIGSPAESFDAEGARLVITVGGDGTLLTASHHVVGTPVLGVNSAPGHSVGFFCGTGPGSVEKNLRRALAGELESVTLTRMEVSRNGRLVSSRVLNDALVCHSCPAATSRYILEIDGITEEQRSSGFWIGPAAGSTAAQRSAGGEVLPLDATDIQLVVREPYNPRGRRLLLTRKVMARGETLLVRSKMFDARMFLDGPAEMQPLALGDVLEFRVSQEPLTLLGLSSQRDWA